MLRCTSLVTAIEREINGPSANESDEKKRKRPQTGTKNQPAKKKNVSGSVKA